MTLYPYQAEGRDWLQSKRFALLADEMGLGKTVQTISAADALAAERLLVLCPAVAVENWLSEISKFSPGRSATALYSEDAVVPRTGTVVLSYHLATTLIAKGRFAGHHFDAGVFDESHFLKEVASERTQRVLGKDGLRKCCRRIWALTGTPMPNHPGELWPLARTFGATRLSYADFVERFCTSRPGYRDKQIITGMRRDRANELRRLLAPIMLQRTAEQVGLQLPELTLGDLVVAAGKVNVSEEIRRRAMEQEAWLAERLQGDTFSPSQMALLEAAAESISTLRFYNGLQKVEPVANLVREELENCTYKKIIIFAIHREVITGLHDRLWELGSSVIHGGVTSPRRSRAVDSFQNDPDCQVIICNIKAAGTAINLTAADQVLFCESEWSPGDNRQALKRAHRIGRTRPVFGRFVGIANSIDQRIQSVNRRKAEDIELVFGTTR